MDSNEDSVEHQKQQLADVSEGYMKLASSGIVVG